MKKLDNQSVRVLKTLRHKSSWVNGKEVIGADVVDKDGRWVQVEILDGPNKGNRKPTTLERLA